MEVNWFEAEDRFYIAGRGILFTGRSPLEVDKSKGGLDTFYEKPWVINHPEARDKIWQVTGVDSYATAWIRKGAPIGILVKPWEMEDA